MASLIEEELARRDAAARPSPQASGRSTYMSPDDRLRAQALEYRKEHDAELMGAREAAMAQKALEADRRAAIATERLGIATDKMGLVEKEFTVREKMMALDEMAKKLSLDQQLQKLDLTEKRMAAADVFFQEAGALDPYAKDFDTKLADLTRRTLPAADHPSVEAHRKYLLSQREKANEYNMQFAPQPPKPKEFGTVTTTTAQGDDGKLKTSTSTTRPAPDPNSPEAKDAALRAEHDALESGLRVKDKDGKVTDKYLKEGSSELAAQVGKLNAVKQKLGYDLLDPKTGQVIPKSAAPVVPAATPTPTVAPVATPPANQAALDWLAANPDDPRAPAIRARLGVK